VATLSEAPKYSNPFHLNENTRLESDPGPFQTAGIAITVYRSSVGKLPTRRSSRDDDCFESGPRKRRGEGPTPSINYQLESHHLQPIFRRRAASIRRPRLTSVDGRTTRSGYLCSTGPETTYDGRGEPGLGRVVFRPKIESGGPLVADGPRRRIHRRRSFPTRLGRNDPRCVHEKRPVDSVVGTAPWRCGRRWDELSISAMKHRFNHRDTDS
jgi:hypothetical protein